MPFIVVLYIALYTTMVLFNTVNSLIWVTISRVLIMYKIYSELQIMWWWTDYKLIMYRPILISANGWHLCYIVVVRDHWLDVVPRHLTFYPNIGMLHVKNCSILFILTALFLLHIFAFYSIFCLRQAVNPF